MQKIIDINNILINEALYLINKDSFLNVYHIPFFDEKQVKGLNLLQRKRENRINKDFAFQKENFTIQKNESGNVRNEPQSYLFNYDINSCKKSFCESLDDLNPKLNNKINIITIL